MRKVPLLPIVFLLFALSVSRGQTGLPAAALHLNDSGYYERPGVNVMVFDDFYPEGHQGGVTIVQCGRRVAANGDVRLEPAPGQWSPVPRVGQRTVDRERGTITVTLWYPDSSKDRKGFNPIMYPDLAFRYSITAEPEGEGIRIVVNLERALPEQWANRVGFNLELFPGQLFGEHFFMDGRAGIFPRQANGPFLADSGGDFRIMPLASGRNLIVAPRNEEKELTIVSSRENLQLIDGRGQYNNGWFVVRSTIPAGAVSHAVEWLITPRVKPGWRAAPVVQVSQVGYHPKQDKVAVIELDRSTATFEPVELIRIDQDSQAVVKLVPHPKPWGMFLRNTYVRFDFTDVTREGIYRVKYGNIESNEFEIARDVFARHVWQPTLEYFLPVQMCHMRINDRYKVWHGLCHMDDALMAPVHHNHFDGYAQGESTLTSFTPGEHIPGVNIGGWHDAGDYDLRVESQAATVYRLALAYEFFRNDYDATSVDQESRVVEMHRPDGKADILQQIEHGLLSIVGGYESLGVLYRGMICPTLRQYVHLGDAATMTDNITYDEHGMDPVLHRPLPKDDRWLFTEVNPGRALYVAQTLAAASRAIAAVNPGLSAKSLKIAEELYRRNLSLPEKNRVRAAGELYLSTSKREYATVLLRNADLIGTGVEHYSEFIGRVAAKLGDGAFTARIERGVSEYFARVREQEKENPYGVPYEPHIWGAGWEIQEFGVQQIFLFLGFPRLMTSGYAFNALNFVLGCHPGENTVSFASGVGVKSLTVAYGANRDEWSYIPGGVGSGTALIRPDLPELKTWPYFWQQTEYVMGGGAMDFMILAMAADNVLNR
jgi:hypothetical protein